MGGEGRWEFEIGEPPVMRNPHAEKGPVESASNVSYDLDIFSVFQINNDIPGLICVCRCIITIKPI